MLIRAAEPADAPQIAALYAPYVRETPISFELVPPTDAEMLVRLQAIGARFPWLVCCDDDRVLGYAYCGRHHERAAYRWSVDCSVYVRQDAHRRGIGRALYETLLPLAQAQGFYNVYAGITLPNPASVALHERMGFKPLGVYRDVGYKLGRWYDVGYWSLMLRPPEATPAEPLDLAALRDSPAWPAALAAGTRFLKENGTRL